MQFMVLKNILQTADSKKGNTRHSFQVTNAKSGRGKQWSRRSDVRLEGAVVATLRVIQEHNNSTCSGPEFRRLYVQYQGCGVQEQGQRRITTAKKDMWFRTSGNCCLKSSGNFTMGLRIEKLKIKRTSRAK